MSNENHQELPNDLNVDKTGTGSEPRKSRDHAGNRQGEVPVPVLSGVLKAFEAELAALIPRAEGLDRDRLMFLAGQASVANSRPTTGLAWPAAFGGMTLVATTLAVLLVMQPAPEVNQQGATAGLPSSAYRTGAETPTLPDKPAVAHRGSGFQPEEDHGQDGRATAASSPAPSSEPPSFLVSLLFTRHGESDPESWKTSYPALRDRILAKGLDSWPQPVSQGDAGPTKPPLTNRELLKELIKNHS